MPDQNFSLKCPFPLIESHWSHVQPIWNHLGSFWTQFWAMFGPCWGHLGSSWGYLGPNWGDFQASTIKIKITLTLYLQFDPFLVVFGTPKLVQNWLKNALFFWLEKTPVFYRFFTHFGVQKWSKNRRFSSPLFWHEIWLIFGSKCGLKIDEILMIYWCQVERSKNRKIFKKHWKTHGFLRFFGLGGSGKSIKNDQDSEVKINQKMTSILSGFGDQKLAKNRRFWGPKSMSKFDRKPEGYWESILDPKCTPTWMENQSKKWSKIGVFWMLDFWPIFGGVTLLCPTQQPPGEREGRGVNPLPEGRGIILAPSKPCSCKLMGFLSETVCVIVPAAWEY